MKPDPSSDPWYRRWERGLRGVWKAVLPGRSGPRIRTVRVVRVPLENPAPPTEPFAVMVHAFYPEVFKEIAELLKPVPFPFQLFITTDKHEKREALQAILDETNLSGKSEIRLVPNRGRDIAPKWIGLADVYPRFRFFLHLHTKKSLFDAELGSAWRTYLYKSLLGSGPIIATNLALLGRPGIGVVYPHYFRSLTVHGKWGANFPATQELLRKMDINVLRGDFDFPAGSMYWARTEALQPLLNLKLKLEDFPSEAGSIDGGVEHAVERSILFIARKAGFRGVPIVPLGHKTDGYRYLE